MADSEQPLLSLIERVQRALVLMAYFIELDGDVYLPLYERLEKELAALLQREDTRERARNLLSAYRRSGDAKAICSKNLSLSSSGGPFPYLGL